MIYGKSYIQLKTIGEGVEDENGDYTPGDDTWSDVILCDAEPARGEANKRVFEDGVERFYSYVITLDVTAPKLNPGDRIRLALDGQLQEREYDVKGFHKYAFMCKAWI